MWPHFRNEATTDHNTMNPENQTQEIEPPSRNRVHKLTGSFHQVPGAWSGTSYGYHPHGVVRRGIIFTDNHNTSGSSDIEVILEPESGLIYPPTDASSSRCGSQSLARLRPKSGGAVRVWQSGQWVGPDGPWRKLIVEILDEIEAEVVVLREQTRLAIEAKNKMKDEAEEALWNKAAAICQTQTTTP